MKGYGSTGFRDLSSYLAQTIAACADVRNRIVHEHKEIDLARTHEVLQTTARNVPQDLTHIHGYPERASREPTHRVTLFALQHLPLQ
jgi:hypothetical protein